MSRIPQSLRRRATGITCALALGASALTGGAVLGVGTAAAATPPVLTITLKGSTGWGESVTGGTGPCKEFVNGTPGTLSYTPPISETIDPTLNLVDKARMKPGMNTVYFECSGTKSNTAFFYADRSPLNDMRTQFSSATNGMFGS
ncbi:MAG: hypothetical protein WAW85_12695 [Gordonia sp. (in: high G+C Gram-positive bacteria)]|uniref:hypothetical protein n=1 Tax=Gordonia sp. (in: high G+C Gram-positive bacteria) TaxID=84139 RepID=UPI003BB5B8EE